MTISSISKNKYTEDINACRSLKFLSKRLHYGFFNNYGMLEITSYPNSFLGDLKHMVLVVFDKYTEKRKCERISNRLFPKMFYVFCIGMSELSRSHNCNSFKAFSISGKAYRYDHKEFIKGPV